MIEYAPLELRVLGFIEGFRRLHRIGPTPEDVVRYLDGIVSADIALRTLGGLYRAGAITKPHARLDVRVPVLSQVFVCNRRFNPEKTAYEHTLEPYNADAVRLERREDYPPQDAVAGEGSHR